MTFSTGSFELDMDPRDWVIPKRTGSAMVSRFTTPDVGVLVLLYVDGTTYDHERPRSMVLALSESMACGMITQLVDALIAADVPAHVIVSMLDDSMAALHMARRAN